MKRKIIILGAGPAGLQTAYFLRGEDYMIIEREERLASFFREFPKNRTLISFNKVHSIYDDPEINLRWDWNSLLTNDYSCKFSQYSKSMYPGADDLVRYLEHFTGKYELNISFNTGIVSIIKEGECYRLLASNGSEYFCEYLVIATGVCKAYIPEIPGIEEVSASYEGMTWEAEKYAGKRVLIIGKGNSAFEIADFLLEQASIIHLASPRSITFAWNTRFSGNVRANYARILDAYQLKLLHGGLDCQIKQIVRDGDSYRVNIQYVHADGEDEWLVYDEVIRATGFRFDSSIFDKSVPVCLAHKGKLPDMSGAWEAQDSKNLFFAGTLTQSKDFRSASSSFIDGFRYSCRTLANFLKSRIYGTPLPYEVIRAEPETLASAILKRVSTTSALWAQFGYLCDLYVIDRSTHTIRHYTELPVDLALDDWIDDAKDYLRVTFKWGPWDGDVFAIDRHPKHSTAFTNVFLHPIIHRFRNGVCIEQSHHVLEDLFGMYTPEMESGIVVHRGARDISRYHHEEHVLPLVRYLGTVLRGDSEIDATKIVGNPV